MAFLQSVLAPFSMKGFYLLTWGTALGANVWNTVSGFRAYKTLPRQTFGTLQSRLTPLFFSFSTITSATLLLSHLWFHPDLISSPTVAPHWHNSEEGIQGLLILGSLIPQAINWLFVGPKTTEIMFERHRLERLEGKEYDEPNPTEAMSKINAKFATYHGISSSLSMLAGVSLAGLGLAISIA